MSVHGLRARLTREDIQRLTDGSDVEGRVLATRKLCTRVALEGFAEADRAAGEAVLALLARDAAEMVRRALAVTLQCSPHLPPSVAKALIADVDSIAIPVISGSPVLTDEELVEIVRGAPEAHQCAVAGRPVISREVVREIVTHATPKAVGITAANDGAHFDAGSYALTFQRFAEAPEVLERFVERSRLPLEVTEKLIAKISDEALQRLVSRHALPAQLAVELAEGARERATVDLVDQAGLSPEPRRFVQQLQLNGRLTPSLILRALFRGHVAFFEHAVAELAGVDHAKAWLLIHDAGPLGLEAVFQRTGLPARILPAVRAALSAYHSIELGADGPADLVRFRKTLTERIFTQFQGAPESDLTYCLERMDVDLGQLGEDDGVLRAAS